MSLLLLPAQAAAQLAILVGVLMLLYAAYLIRSVMKVPTGNKKSEDIASAIREGANAYLKRQYLTLIPLVVILLIAISYLTTLNSGIAFLAGVLCSALAGFIGMYISTRANSRTAFAAAHGTNAALQVAVKGGAVTGVTLVGLGLIGVSAIYLVLGDTGSLIGFGFGASLISLFARVGGGIFTKAADVGADIVGKVEKGIPEDDERNPAVIADNVGDNVGDCAGMAADLFESYAVTIIAAMLLGTGLGGAFVSWPLLIASAGALASVFGLHFIKLGSGKNIMHALYKGVVATAVFALAMFWALPTGIPLFLSAAVGILLTGAIFLITEYYTSTDFSPVKEVAKASQTGAGTNVISGLALGMQSTALPMLSVIAAIAVSYTLAGTYGVALAATAMLSLTGIVITLDAYGPITDNAGGIAEMSGAKESVRKVTDALDAVGNTTKATTKGFAIAGAALGALTLFAAFAEEAHITDINLLHADVVIGLFIGALLPFLFSSFLMKAVGRAAFEIVEEVRRQFRTIKGIMTYKAKPDYARAVDISTKAALRELLVPGLLAVVTPLAVGLLFGVQALGGMLAGAIASGFLLAIMLSTSGGAWDNAKKYIEMGKYGGKGSEAHKNAVTGDTVGDPCKDTAGPALNSLIKVINTIAILAASTILAYAIKLV